MGMAWAAQCRAPACPPNGHAVTSSGSRSRVVCRAERSANPVSGSLKILRGQVGFWQKIDEPGCTTGRATDPRADPEACGCSGYAPGRWALYTAGSTPLV